MNTEYKESASEYLLQAAIDTANIGLWDWNLISGQIIWLGHHEKLFGLAPGEFDGMYASFEKRIHPDDVEELNRVVQQARAAGSEYAHEYRVVWPDGSIHWVAGRGSFVYNAAGQAVRMFGVVLDITERKQAESELRKQKEFLQTLFDRVPAVITLHETDGRIRLVNSEFERTLGWSLNEITDQNLDVLAKMYPDPQVRQGVSDFIERADGRSEDFRTRTKDGRVLDISWTKVRLSDGSIVGVGKDMTERKQTEATPREVHQRLNMLVEKAPLALVTIDARAIVQTWNPAAERLFGWTADEVLGRPIPIIPEEERQSFEEFLAGELRGETRNALEIRRLRKDGSLVEVSLWTTPLHDAQGEIVGALGMFIDITARKAYEAALNSLLLISENLHRNLETDKLLGALIIEAMKLTDSKLGWVGLPTRQGMTLARHISHDFEVVPFEYTWPPGVGWPGWVLVHRVPYLSNDAEADPVIVPEIRERFGVKSGIDTPILDAAGNILGFFEVNNKQSNGGYNEHDVELLTAIARIASVALQNASSYQNLQRAERALQDTKSKLELILETSPLPILGIDPEGRITSWNQAAERIFGWTAGEVVGRVCQTVPAEGMQDYFELLGKVIRGETFTGLVRYRRKKSGALLTCSLSFAPQRNEWGLPIGITAILEDITERQQAEEELHRYATRMATLVEIARTFAEAGLDYQGLLNTVARRTAELIGDSCVITLFSHDNQRAFPAAFHHPDPQALALMEEALLHIWQGGTDTERFRVLLAGEAIYIPVVDAEEYRAQSEPEFWRYVDDVGVSSALIVPLKAQSHVIGTLGITRDRQGNPYTRDDLILLQNIADRAALSIQNAQLFRQVEGAREQLGALSRRLLEVQEAERRALTTELHDRVGQNLTGLSINLQNMKALLSEEAARALAAKFDDAQALVEDTTRQIRDLMAELYPPELEDYGLAVALETYAERAASRGNLDLIADLPDLVPSPLPLDLRIALFRAAQEAFNNVLKHAGATQLEVSLEQRDGRIRLTVQDNGRGFEPDPASEKEAQTWGLKIMRERIESIGGQVKIESEPGKGTQVTFEIERPPS